MNAANLRIDAVQDAEGPLRPRRLPFDAPIPLLARRGRRARLQMLGLGGDHLLFHATYAQPIHRHDYSSLYFNIFIKFICLISIEHLFAIDKGQKRSFNKLV